jgi:hypothetical protein
MADPPEETADAEIAAADAEAAVAAGAEAVASAEPIETAPPEDFASLGDSQTHENAQVADTVEAIEAAVGDGGAAVVGAALPQVTAQAVGLALLNAVNAQQNAYVTANATVLATVARILALRGAEPVAETGAVSGD